MKKILLLLCLLTLAACAARKPVKGFDSDFDSGKSWAELQAQLPAYPKAENLLPFDAGPASNNLHYIDAPSIVVGEDGIVRYTLVIKSPTGAVNVSYEGMRCATDGKRESARLKILILKFQISEKRLYAIGRDDRDLGTGAGIKMGGTRRYLPALCRNGRFPDISSARLMSL